MPTRPSKEKNSSGISRFQSFVAETIDRAQIKNAPYNPRTIDAFARKKLREKIQKVGLVETLVWNARTGNLVGGHQRLSILDQLEKNKEYKLTVARVDLDEKEERELNVFLNNTSSQGSYDIGQLEKLIVDCDVSQMGFDRVDLELMFDDPKFSPITDSAKDGAASSIEAIGKLKSEKKKQREKNKLANDAEFYLVLVFGDRAEADTFLRHFKQQTDCRYLDGRRIAQEFGLELQTAQVAP